MTANLLAHSDIFRAGIARSGAYNRTLTPFGFQNEQRTFWEVPQIYAAMSPFYYAHKINEPILLIHGEADDNSGTFPIQSERFYMALKGHGATVRYVTLPYEAHGYAARESVLHTVAEMLNWANEWAKNAKPRTTELSSSRGGLESARIIDVCRSLWSLLNEASDSRRLSSHSSQRPPSPTSPSSRPAAGKGMGMCGTMTTTTYIKGNKMRTDTVIGDTTRTMIFDVDAPEALLLRLEEEGSRRVGHAGVRRQHVSRASTPRA